MQNFFEVCVVALYKFNFQNGKGLRKMKYIVIFISTVWVAMLFMPRVAMAFGCRPLEETYRYRYAEKFIRYPKS
jgi:hypothetical protein